MRFLTNIEELDSFRFRVLERIKGMLFCIGRLAALLFYHETGQETLIKYYRYGFPERREEEVDGDLRRQLPNGRQEVDAALSPSFYGKRA